MAQWEYTQERIERPLGSEGRGVTPEAMREINQFGADSWEVCSILADQQAWIVLLKREIPGLGMGGLRGPGRLRGLRIGHTPMNMSPRALTVSG
jgi:hypothetical protein